MVIFMLTMRKTDHEFFFLQAAFIITLGGLSSLQKTINNTSLDAATQTLYTDVFQSAGQVCGTVTPQDTPADKLCSAASYPRSSMQHSNVKP